MSTFLIRMQYFINLPHTRRKEKKNKIEGRLQHTTLHLTDLDILGITQILSFSFKCVFKFVGQDLILHCLGIHMR